MEQEEKLYQKGFNGGYILAKHEPKLMDKLLLNRNPENEFFEGLRLGRKEFEKEKMLDQLKGQDNSRGREIERDE